MLESMKLRLSLITVNSFFLVLPRESLNRLYILPIAVWAVSIVKHPGRVPDMSISVPRKGMDDIGSLHSVANIWRREMQSA